MMSIRWIKFIAILFLGPIILAGCRFGQRTLPTPAPLTTQQSNTSVSLSGAVNDPVNDPTRTNETYRIQKGEIVTRLSFTGRVTLEREQELYFEQNGRLGEVYVENGDFVEAGMLMAELELDERLVELAVAELEVEIVESQIADAAADRIADQELASQQLRVAEVLLEEMRAKELAAPGSVSSSTLGQAEFEVIRSQFALEKIERADDLALQKELLQAEGRVESIQSEILKSRIFAPYAGKVRFISTSIKKTGNIIEGYAPVLSISDLNSLQIEGYPTTTQQDLLLEDMAVEVQLPYRSGTSIPATIKLLPYPQGSSVESFTQIEVEEESYEMLRIGAEVEIIATIVHENDALWVPPDAIRGFGDSRFVVIVDGATRQEVAVRLGIQTEEKVEIIAGVEEGQVVMGRE